MVSSIPVLLCTLALIDHLRRVLTGEMTGYNAFIPKFDLTNLVLKYIGVLIYVLNIFFWKFFKKTSRVKASTMDLNSEQNRFLNEQAEELFVEESAGKLPWWKRVWRMLF